MPRTCQGLAVRLPAGERTMEGYARWVGDFLDVSDLDAPALVVGHSFGGGVAIRLAHDAPERVRHLVLINSVGSPSASSEPALAARPSDRPAWNYGFHLVKELFWSRDGYRIIQAIGGDVVRNVTANPATMIEIGMLARRADLTAELAELRRRELPILVLWSNGDGVLPLASFDALCAAIGTDGKVLSGGHSWLLARPRALSEVLDNVVQVQLAEHETIGVRTTTAELRDLLRHTKIPKRVVTRLLSAASPLWMMSEQPAALAADLALCHPPLARGEVRAVSRPTEDPGTFRLTVVAADRPGLLADSAAVLARQDLAVHSASAVTWTDSNIALHSLTLASTAATEPDWDALGVELRAMAKAPPSTVSYTPAGRATVIVDGSGAGRSMVRVTAPDGRGLLEAISRWFAECGVSIEAAEISTHDDIATDRFLVAGTFDPLALETHLSRTPSSLCDRLRPRVCGLVARGVR